MKKYPEIDEAEAEDMTICVLEHYLKHNDVVKRKLVHAQGATSDTIRDVKSIYKDECTNDNAPELPDMDVMKRYEEMWGDILALFNEASLSEEELVRIELILSQIPKLIRVYYDGRIEKDAVLQGLIKELSNPKYAKALDYVRKFQDLPDPLSGLAEDEFEIEIKGVKAFRIMPKSKS